MTVRLLLICCIFLQLLLAPALGTGASLSGTQEDLQYRVSLGPWSDVARLHLVLTETKPGHYRAEFFGAAQGMWRLLNRWLPERYSTEMVWRQGRLLPLVYREEFMDKGEHIIKEYHFDYELQRLSLRRRVEGGAWVKKWEVPLTTPIYDLLSLYYNVRLEALGPLRAGANLHVSVLASKPRKLVFRLGEKTDQGLKVLLNFRPQDSDTEDQYFIELNSQRVPTLAWTRVTFFGKLAGHLLNPGGIRQGLLPAVASRAN